jgi:hypothetical protein
VAGDLNLNLPRFLKRFEQLIVQYLYTFSNCMLGDTPFA